MLPNDKIADLAIAAGFVALYMSAENLQVSRIARAYGREHTAKPHGH